jgi:hypothetical protein
MVVVPLFTTSLSVDQSSSRSELVMLCASSFAFAFALEEEGAGPGADTEARVPAPAPAFCDFEVPGRAVILAARLPDDGGLPENELF